MLSAAAMPRLITPTEAGRLLGVGRTRVYELMARGDLKSTTIGRSRRVFADSVDEYVARRLDESGGRYR